MLPQGLCLLVLPLPLTDHGAYCLHCSRGSLARCLGTIRSRFQFHL